MIFVEFLVGYVAGALGILLGFGIQGLIDLDKDRKTMNDFLKLIHEELLEIKEKLTLDTNKAEILYTDTWDSVISSGAIRLFSAEQVTKISKIYKLIKNYSFEAEFIRNGLEKLNLSRSRAAHERCLEFTKTVELNSESRNNKLRLSKQIDQLLKESWWKAE